MADEGNVIIIKKGKGGGHGGAHGGAWKVAFADFMTAMMCFFLVMWLMSADSETKAAISEYFKNPSSPWRLDLTSKKNVPLGDKTAAGNEIMPGQQGLFPEDLIERPSRPFVAEPKPLVPLQDVVEEMVEKEDELKPMSIDMLKFSIPEKKLFQGKSDQLTEEAVKYLTKVGKLTKHYAGYLTVRGYTVPVPDRSDELDSYELTNARVVKVAKYLIDNKLVDEDRTVHSVSNDQLPKSIPVELKVDQNAKESRIEFVIGRDKGPK